MKKPTLNGRFHFILLVVLAILVSALIRGRAESENTNPQVKSYDEVLSLIKKHSLYEPSDEDIAKIHECILQRAFQRFEVPKGNLEKEISIQGCFKQDKRAHYVPPLDAKLKEENVEGFYGIGAMIKLAGDLSGAKIDSLIEGGAAKESGLLKEGDIIVAAGESEDKIQSFSGLSLAEMTNLIRGPANTMVFLKVIRDGKELPIIIKIIRKEVKDKIYEIKLINNQIIYLKIFHFMANEAVFQEIQGKLFEFYEAGASSLIIDVRDNPGGYLMIATEFLKQFAPEKGVFLETHGRNNKIVSKFMANSIGDLSSMQIAVLINKNSASASELVTGALQRWGATVFGETSYGKGSVQTQFSLEDGGILAITVQTYHFIDGVTPEDGGIEPDVFTDKPLDEAIKHLSNE